MINSLLIKIEYAEDNFRRNGSTYADGQSKEVEDDSCNVSNNMGWGSIISPRVYIQEERPELMNNTYKNMIL